MPPIYAAQQYASGQWSPQQQQGGSAWDAVNQVVGSPLGQMGIGALGGALQQRGANQRQQQMLQQTGAQAIMGDQYRRAALPSQTRPIGESQEYMQSQALKAAIAGMLESGDYRSTPGDPAVAAAMGSGMQFNIPDELKHYFSPEGVQQGGAAELLKRDQDFLRVDPHAAQTDMGALGLDEFMPEGGDPRELTAQMTQDQIQQVNQAVMAEQGNWEALYGPAPDGYEYDENGQLKKKGSSWWKKALAIVGGGAAVALTGGALAPVVGPTMAGVLGGAAGGAASAAIGGGNPLAGAIAGGGAGGLGAALPGANPAMGTPGINPQHTWQDAIKGYAKDPRTYAGAAAGSLF